MGCSFWVVVFCQGWKRRYGVESVVRGISVSEGSDFGRWETRGALTELTAHIGVSMDGGSRMFAKVVFRQGG